MQRLKREAVGASITLMQGKVLVIEGPEQKVALLQEVMQQLVNMYSDKG